MSRRDERLGGVAAALGVSANLWLGGTGSLYMTGDVQRTGNTLGNVARPVLQDIRRSLA